MGVRPAHVPFRPIQRPALHGLDPGRVKLDDGLSPLRPPPRSGVRRLTRIHARSVEQPVNLDDGDDVFDWPWLYGVEVGHWDLTDAQAQKLREYLLRGGFFMCDDFHGSREWEVFAASMQPRLSRPADRRHPNEDAIFHTIYDLDDRYQVPGAQFLETGQTYEHDGMTAAAGAASTTTRAG